MKKPSVHLFCNAHIDPVWLWEWEEGAAEALATFRSAAELCQRFDGFVFCHNEAILYRWVEEHEPALFERIRELVRAGRWHVTGGWWLQPDCNMPSGESFVRQILLGKRWFREKLGVDVKTGSNLDPFGHSRGLVQILAKSGYDSYVFCRPTGEDCPLPDDAFTWVGFDGSRIAATLASSHYNSPPGGARRKVEEWIEAHPDRPCSLVPWGVGNHGGGPSRRDLEDLAELMRARRDATIRHSTPERYFRELRRCGARLEEVERDLNPWAVGCYTSMARVKRRHRELEGALFAAEKMAVAAAWQDLLEYPAAELGQAARDLAGSQFHDALPGSSTEPVQAAVLRQMDHGLEILSRVRARAFFALASGQPAAAEGQHPILVYNPHPWPVATIVECELQPRWPHGTDAFLEPRVERAGRRLPAQAEKESSNIDEDHRKRVVFPAVLEPSRMNRFDCRLVPRRGAPRPALREEDGRLRFATRSLEVIVNCRTGLVDRYRAGGVDYLERDALRPLVMRDDADPWGMRVRRFRKLAGRFRLMSRQEGTRLSGVTERLLPSVRVVEDGPVRSTVEVMLGFGRSYVCQRYKLPRKGTEIEVECRVHWAEKDRMLKLSIPTTMRGGACLGQVAFGVAELSGKGDEAVAQKWAAVVSREQDMALTCIDDGVHGLDMARGELRLSLLRSPAYAGHPVGDRPIAKQDRYTPRIDQGEHVFRFWLNGGRAGQRLARVDREALARAERPFALCFFPSGEGRTPEPGPVLSDPVVQVSAIKQSERGEDLILRLFEPTGRRRATWLSLPFAGARTRVRLAGFEVRTLRFDRRRRRFAEVDLLEEPVR